MERSDSRYKIQEPIDREMPADGSKERSLHWQESPVRVAEASKVTAGRLIEEPNKSELL